MSSAKTIVVRCPHCMAVTKVSGVPETKETIHCPKCRKDVSLAKGKPYKGRSKPDPAPGDVVPEHARPLENPDKPVNYRVSSSRRSRENAALVRVLSLVGVVVVLAVIGGVGYFIWKNLPSQLDAYRKLIREELAIYKEATDALTKVKNLVDAKEAQSKLPTYLNRVFHVENRRNALPPLASDDERNQLRQLLESLATAKAQYKDAESRLRRILGTEENKGTELEPPKVTKSAPEGKDGPDLTIRETAKTTPESDPKTPPADDPEKKPVAATPPEKAPSMPPSKTAFGPERTVVVTLLRFSKDRVTPAFLEGLGKLTDEPPGSVEVSWSGDLCRIEMAPVGNVDGFAARINFGEVTRINQRTITVLADEPKSTHDVGTIAPLPPRDPVKESLALLKSKVADQRILGLERLRKLRPNDQRGDVVKAVTELLADPETAVRVYAIRTLPVWAGPEAVPPLLKLLEDANAQVRQAAIEELGHSQDRRAAEPLAKMLGKHRDHVGTALRNLGPVAEAAVQPMLSDPDIEVRIEACRILGKIGSLPSSGAILLRMVQQADLDPRLKEAAREALASMASRPGA